MENLTTFEACCKVTGDDSTKEYSKQDRLEIIIKAINNNVPPNWNDEDERKHYPFFWVEKDSSKPSGFGLSLYVVDFAYTHTGVGSRLTFRTEEGAEHAVEHFLADYEAVYL